LRTNLPHAQSWHHLSIRAVTASLAAAMLYIIARHSRVAAVRATTELPTLFTWFGSAVISLLVWYELRPASVAPAWALLGLALFEIGLWRSFTQLRIQAYVSLGSAFLRVLFVNLNAPAGLTSAGWYTVLPVSAALFYVYEQLERTSQKLATRETGVRVLSAAAGTICLVGLVRMQTPLDWVAAAWALMVLALVIIAVQLRRKLYADYALVLAAAVLARAWMHNFYERSYFPAPWHASRVVTVGAAALLLLAAVPFSFRLPHSDRPLTTHSPLGRLMRAIADHPEQWLFFLPAILVATLIASELHRGSITVGWGVEALAIIAIAIVVRQRSYRLAGLGLVCVCIAKIIVADVWALNMRERALTFLALGTSVLLVSLMYSRYREAIREYL
jgi:hypothetical protein